MKNEKFGFSSFCITFPKELKEKIQNQDFRENLLKYLEDVVKEDLDLFRGNIFNIVRICHLKLLHLPT